MNLVIRAHTLKNETLTQAITGHFDERGGTIGRSDTNTLTLPDPERHISRLQAEVWFSNSTFSIRNVGSANAITVNGRQVNPGEGSPLGHGDEIVVGGYGMRATITDNNEPATEAPIDARTVIKASASDIKTNPRMRVPPAPVAAAIPAPVTAPAPAPAAASGSNPFADLLGNAPPPSIKDPFAGLLGAQPSPHHQTTAAHIRMPTPPAVAARLPDDFDPFADLPSPPATPASSALDSFMRGGPTPAAPSAASLPTDLGLGELLGASSAPPSSLDDMFGLSAPAAPGSDPLASFLAAPKPDSAAASENKDPMAMFGTAAAPAPAVPADFNHTPEMKAAYVPPAVVAPPAAKPPAPTTPAAAKPAPLPVPPAAPRRMATPSARVDDVNSPSTVPGVKPARPVFDSAPAPLDALPSSSAAADPLWAAFCEGAGVNIKLPQGLTPELMKVIGQVLHHSIDGTIKLVAVRAAAKQELKADVTTIQARNNNPLKFSPDAGVAIEQLLQPPMRGFMMGPAAVNDVMDDLLGHAIGTMAGMRAALAGVLDRFEPARLEGKLAGNSVLDSVLPMNRRSKLWELYLQHYKRIRDDAQDDFHDLFGKAFIDAYEEQLDRLDASRHPI
ncbi:MAG TPA: type VI secretion system-associated FHA domain protein TagH [Rhizobacter sp.]|nr:type VI secretion system-associated FHA domain protein TagH [Rhizobacter sp.]